MQTKTIMGFVIGVCLCVTFIFGSAGAQVVYPVKYDYDWNFWSNGPHMFAIPAGNIGIGTDNPVSKLHVTGDVLVEAENTAVSVALNLLCRPGNSTMVNFSVLDPWANNWTISRDGDSTNFLVEEHPKYLVSDGSRLMVESGTGKVGINTKYPLQMVDIRPVVSGYTDLGIRLDPNSGVLYGATAWQIENNHAVFRIVEDKGMPGYPQTRVAISPFTGNVGIGTEDPENTLHVNGPVNLDPVTEPSTPSAGFVLYVDELDGNLKAKSSLGSITIIAYP